MLHGVVSRPHGTGPRSAGSKLARCCVAVAFARVKDGPSISDMASSLTCENLRDELRSFAQDTLQRFVAEICERVRKEVRDELHHATERGLRIIPPISPISSSFRHVDGDPDDGGGSRKTPTIRGNVFISSALAEAQLKQVLDPSEDSNDPSAYHQDLPRNLIQSVASWGGWSRNSDRRASSPLSGVGRNSLDAAVQQSQAAMEPAGGRKENSLAVPRPEAWPMHRLTGVRRPASSNGRNQVAHDSGDDADELRMLANAPRPLSLAGSSPRHSFNSLVQPHRDDESRASNAMVRNDCMHPGQTNTAATAAAAVARAAAAAAAAATISPPVRNDSFSSELPTAPRAGRGKTTPVHRLTLNCATTAEIKGSRLWDHPDAHDDDSDMFNGSEFEGGPSTIVKTQEMCFSFVKSLIFDSCCAAMIFANAVTIGWQTDYMARHVLAEAPASFQLIELFFCVNFVLELALRFFAYGRRFFRSRAWKWNVFDCCLVSFQVVELSVAVIVRQESGGQGSGSWGFMRALRIIRLLRIVRIFRVLRFLRDLRTLIISVGASIRPLAWSVVILLLMLYVVAMYFTEVVLDHRVNPSDDTGAETAANTLILIDHFGSLNNSVFTLYQVITGGMDWRDVTDPLMHNIGSYVGYIFAFYIAFAVICMINLFTGIFVQTALQHAEHEKQLETVNSLRDILTRKGDTSVRSEHNGGNAGNGGYVSASDFEAHLSDPEMQRYLRDIDVDATSASGLFQLLDPDDCGLIPINQVLTGCIRLRGPAKSIDLAALMWELKSLARSQADYRIGLERYLNELSNTLTGLVRSSSSPSMSSVRSPSLFFARAAGDGYVDGDGPEPSCMDCGDIKHHIFGCGGGSPSSCSSC